MGKGRKSFHKEYEPPEEQFLVVVDAWGQSEDRNRYTNNVGAWFEIMLRRVYPKEKPQIFRVWYQGTHQIIIVELPEVVKDIRPFLGVHPYATFLTTPGAVGSDKVVTIYEYNFRRFDHPERRNWKESCPSYREIHPKFPVRDPYPLPGDIGLHLLIPVPHPPLNAPYAIPVPAPAIPANLGPPPMPQSNCGEGLKSTTSVGHTRQYSPPRIAGPSRNVSQPPPGESPSRDAHPSPPPQPVSLTPHCAPQPAESLHSPSEHQPTPQPSPQSSRVPSQPDSAFTPYIPSSHHPAHSILTDARRQAYSRERKDSLPRPPERGGMLPPPSKKKMDLDPYEEDEVAQKLLSLSRHPSEYPPEQGRQELMNSSRRESSTPGPSYRTNREPTPSNNDTPRRTMAAPASPCVVVKPEPIDASLPLLPFAHPSNISSSPHTSSHSSHSPPTSQPNVKVKLEDRGSPKAYESSTATVEGQAEDATMAEEGDDDEYEPSSELLEALADLDDFASLLGDEPLESSPARARTPNPRPKHEPSQTPVRVKPEPMDEDHFLVHPPPRGPQASPSVRPTPSTAQARVKPEPMDEDHYLAQPSARGPQPSPSARPIPATVARVQVKPEPMDEDSIPPHSRRESVPRNEGYKRYDRDDTRRRSPQRHGDREDYRRSPSRHDYQPHLHSYGSPQARWRGNPDDRRSSDNNHRKRDREARDEGRWSNGEGGRQWNKRPRVKMEDTRN